jgi:hypothetical protein
MLHSHQPRNDLAVARQTTGNKNAVKNRQSEC